MLTIEEVKEHINKLQREIELKKQEMAIWKKIIKDCEKK
jgi:hypothetical protein